MNTTKRDALFCVGQKAFIEKDGKVLVLFDPSEGLDFPGGKIQEGEAKEGDRSSLTNALKREVREETGIEIEVFDPFEVWYHEFPTHHRNAGKVVYLVAFKCKYVSGEVLLSEEHNNYRWVDNKNYKEVDDGGNYFDLLEKYFAKEG
jgi:8-oxo-dGTP diphosphatase